MQLITLKERHNVNENEGGQLIFTLVETREPTALFIHQYAAYYRQLPKDSCHLYFVLF